MATCRQARRSVKKCILIGRSLRLTIYLVLQKPKKKRKEKKRKGIEARLRNDGQMEVGLIWRVKNNVQLLEFKAHITAH